MYHWFSKILLLVLITALLVVSTGLYLVWAQTRREYAAFVQRHEEMNQRLREIQQQRSQQEAYLRAFLTDADFVERVVRERLGYVAPDETIFRYDRVETP